MNIIMKKLSLIPLMLMLLGVMTANASTLKRKCSRENLSLLCLKDTFDEQKQHKNPLDESQDGCCCGEEKEDEDIDIADEEEDGEDNAPMDVDDFINYALSYAKEIECVLYNKAKYAVEERADYMKEDKTPLTRKNARNLIDHAADLAERPGVVKAIFGFMNPKYDKEGRLILREEHFRI